MKLSVIVPVYNVENTLARCIESIVAQNVDKMEIILVNDGSTDNSGNTAKELAAKFSLITFINQENQGLSSARNTGIEISKGRYITFVDSDDWLKPGTYQSLLKVLEEHQECDILEYSFEKRKANKSENVILTNREFDSPKKYWLEGKAYKHTYACNKIFKRELFFPINHTQIRFPIGKIFEDINLISQLLYFSPKIITSSIIGYIYEWNPNGITEGAKGKDLSQLLNSHIEVSNQLNINFMSSSSRKNKLVKKEETELYISILNIQISVYRYTHKNTVLPYLKINRNYHKLSLAMSIKILFHNIFGLNSLCRLLSI